jgi:Cys-tRNA(Pro) deacylase
MEQHLPDGAERVQQFLIEKGSRIKVQFLPDTTATALDAANSLGVHVSEIGKSIVFGSRDRTLVAIVSGDRRVDVTSLSKMLGGELVKALRADDVERCTGYVIGGVSPLGLPANVEIIIDSGLRGLTKCYIAAGHPKAVLEIGLDDLVLFTGARVFAIASS